MPMCFFPIERRSDLRSCFPSVPMRHRFSVRASTKKSSSSFNRKLIVINSVVIVALAVANRVLYKLALVPMKQYPFFLAQLNTFGYMLIYFTILFTRRRLGIVISEMMSVPKWRFAIIGFLEALGVAAGMAAAAMLPGPVIPILNQTFLVWQLVFAVLILGRRFLLNQISGYLLVAVGVVVAVSSGSGEDHSLSRIGFLWPVVMVASAAFQAGASIIKEFVFRDATKRLEGNSLDIFVVNSFGSGFQGCDGAPILPLLYIATNLLVLDLACKLRASPLGDYKSINKQVHTIPERTHITKALS